MGKYFSLDIIRNLAKIAGVGLLFFCIAFAVGFTLSRTMYPDERVQAANIILDQPTYNWYVCEDLGLGTIPGLPDARQILRLCHNQGWEIRAYCLQPSLPAPPVGQTCSHTPSGTYWCGDSYQLLEEFALDVTPTPTLRPSETNTSVPTQTPIPSITPTPDLTFSATPVTPTSTEIPTDTPPPTFTPRLTRTSTQMPTVTNTPAPSVTGTIISSQTPLATLTDVPPLTEMPSQTPETASTTTPEGITETPVPTFSVTQTLTPTGVSGTPAPTNTPALNSPTPTVRPRPGGGGNLGTVGLWGTFLAVLCFAIGFLGLVLLKKFRFELRMTSNIPHHSNSTKQNSTSMNRWLLLLVFFGLILAVSYLASVWVPQLIIGQPRPMPISVLSPLSRDTSLTPTPFQPRHPTPVYDTKIEPAALPPFDFQGIDFAPQAEPFLISIDPPSPQVNRGKPIDLPFIPSEICDFGDQRACVSSHSVDQQNLIFLTIHSGYGGEAQAFRHAVEGTGINRAAFSLEHIDANLDALQNAQVSITRNGDEAGGFAVSGVIRIPAAQIDDYFDLPIEDALKFGASINPSVWSKIDASQPLLIFETCGWKQPSEPGTESVSDTTGSVYIVVIQPTR